MRAKDLSLHTTLSDETFLNVIADQIDHSHQLTMLAVHKPSLVLFALCMTQQELLP